MNKTIEEINEMAIKYDIPIGDLESLIIRVNERELAKKLAEQKKELAIECEIRLGEEAGRLFIKHLAKLAEQKEEIRKIIEEWEHGYTNYMTQMDNKKNFERGEMAKELKEEIIKKLT